MVLKNKVLTKRNLSSSNEHCIFLNVRLFYSCLSTTKYKQELSSTQLLFVESLLKLAKSTTTIAGITQAISNLQNTSSHSALAIAQCNRRWSTVSSLFLHMQHKSIMIIPHFASYQSSRSLPNKLSTQKMPLWEVPCYAKSSFMKTECFVNV